MLKFIIVFFAIVLGVAVAIVLWFIRRSPEGNEDRRGFRYGSPDKPSDPPAKDEPKISRLETGTPSLPAATP